NGTNYHTDDHGNLHLTLPYGYVHIVASKAGYESVTTNETLDFDPFFYVLGNKQTDAAERKVTFAMKSVGIPVSFTAKDYFTGDPITAGDFSVGDVVASPDTNGLVSLTIPATDAATVDVVAKFSAIYATKTVAFPLKNSPSSVTFV